jgi:hypothetical protein
LRHGGPVAGGELLDPLGELEGLVIESGNAGTGLAIDCINIIVEFRGIGKPG